MLPRFLLDTHILVRWLIEPARLSREQARILRAAVRHTEPVALSAISLLEIAVLTSGKKLRLDPLTCEVASEVASLDSLRDPADRTIVATARVHRLRLVTSDRRIIDSKLVPVIE